MNTTLLLLIGLGAFLLWAGIRGKNPVDELKKLLRGEGIA